MEPDKPVVGPTDGWEPYASLIEDDMIPDYGVQIFTYVDTQGRRGYKWNTVGETSIEEIVMMLTRVSFLLQFRSELTDLSNMPVEDDDEDESN